MYILHNNKELSAQRFYIGITNDLDRRLFEHNSGESNFTSKFGPWKLVYYEAYIAKIDAEKREKQLKITVKDLVNLKKE